MYVFIKNTETMHMYALGMFRIKCGNKTTSKMFVELLVHLSL